MFAERSPLPRLTWLAAAAATALTAFALAHNPVVPAPPQVDVEPPINLPITIHDTIGDSCASDIAQSGSRIYVHLRENPQTCAGVTRVYRIENDRMIFETELPD